MATPSDQDPPGSFQWNPFVGLAIALVLLMLALPVGMVGWFLRGYQLEKTAQQAKETENSAIESSESDNLLRQALELAATNWNPTTELGFPEIQLIVPPGEEIEAVALLESWANQVETILLPLTEEQEAEYREYLIGLWSDDLHKLDEMLKNKNEYSYIKNNIENIDNKYLTIKITIKSE